MVCDFWPGVFVELEVTLDLPSPISSAPPFPCPEAFFLSLFIFSFMSHSPTSRLIPIAMSNDYTIFRVIGPDEGLDRCRGVA